MKKISNKGFTLIELLATILIIGLVLGVTTYGIIISVNKAKEKSTILSLASIKEAARTYSGELGEDSWKNISDYEDTYFCVTIEELINKGLLNKNAKSIENGGKIVDYVVVIKNKTTKVIKKEEILTESNSDTVAYQICTGNIKNENITNGTKITNRDSSTDEAYINFTDAYSESEDIVIIKKYCKYSDSSTKLDSGAKEGTITDDNKCILKGLTQDTKYWVRVCEETERRSVSCDTGSVTTKNIVAPNIAIDTNKNNSVKITYDNSNIKEEAFYYFKSTIDGISSEKVSTCSLYDNKYTCNNDSVNNITKDTWYRTTSKEISITYSTPGNITVTAETRDKSNNSTLIYKEFSLYKTTFNKGNADKIGGQTNNIELMCLANKGETCSITSPSIEKSGYQVIGWNTNSSATTSSWNVNTTKSINSTKVYYPILKLATYTITYDNNGGSGCTTKSVAYNSQIGSLCTPSRTGYTFIGWYNSDYKDNPLNYYADTYSDLYNAFGYDADKLYNHYLTYGVNENRRISQYISTDIYNYSSNKTIYAGWKINKVNIRFNTNGGIVTSETTTASENTYKWMTDSNGLISRTNANGNTYSSDFYSINYGKQTGKDGLINYNNSKYLNITRTGYSAVSGNQWICQSGCTTNNKTFNQASIYKASDFCDASNGDCTVTLGVNWEQVINDYRCSTSDNNNYYLITTCNDTTCKYTRNNCNSNTSGTISRDAIMQCKETTIKGDRCDSSLKNMYSITTCTAADCKYTSKNSNTTISGTIDRCNLRSCPIATFYSNGGTFSNGTSSYEFNIRVGANYSFKDIPEVTRENYTFVNWNTKADGTGTSYNSDSNFTGNENITLYAIWRKNIVTINFKINDGIVANNNENFSKDNDNYILKNGIRYSQTIDYNKSMADSGIKYGLTDCDNEGYLNISRTGYIAVSGAEWICLSGNCKRSTYNQDTNTYTASSFCDASGGDCTITLGVNWEKKDVINDYRCSVSSNSEMYYITTCNDTTCKYTSKNDTTTSGTVNRNSLTICPTATFYPNGGAFSNGVSSYKISIRSGKNYYFSDINLPTLTRTNYTLDGWHDGSTSGTVYRQYFYITKSEGDQSFYANWNYNGSGGSSTSGTVSKCGNCTSNKDCYKPSSSTTICNVQCINSMCVWFPYKTDKTCSTVGMMCY